MNLPQSALGTADKGDYLWLTNVVLRRKGYQYVNNIETCYNLSKNRVSQALPMQAYFNVSPVLFILLIVAAVFLVPAGYYLGCEYVEQTMMAGASLAGFYGLFLVARVRNTFSAYRMRKPMKRYMAPLQKQRDTILASLSQYH
ncbi:hypothetical protein [Photobacterium nomapromontoriensis]|uniref:hypothetical protein n=1 Tax=Photobacterium nomapromontoriensis TaxID=2910237 RepID=UPI003D0E3058